MTDDATICGTPGNDDLSLLLFRRHLTYSLEEVYFNINNNNNNYYYYYYASNVSSSQESS